MSTTQAQSSTEVEERVLYVRVPPEIHEMTRAVANIEDRSMSGLIRQALMVYFIHQGYMSGGVPTPEERVPEWLKQRNKS